MAHQSLYRRYRPRRFSEVRGQQHLVDALRNAVIEDRLGHAYLFSGPRGTGKTSTARILAKVLNCESPIEGEPCCECASCLSIEAGNSFDVHELDAASNNGVDAIRELIARASLGTPGRTKVYILDEVHMLSTAASNALLKTLEEPPDHVVFVLATTDPQKVLPTIRSRTQHFEVTLLSAADLGSLVDFVVTDAELELSPEGRSHVLRAGAGSARDTLSALDRVVAAGGVPDGDDAVDELVEALCERDTGRALIAVEGALARGRNPRVLGESLISQLRDVFLAAVGADLSRLTDTDRARVTDQARRLGAVGATRALESLGDAFVGIQDALDPRIPLEVALVRLTRPDADTSVAALAERITRLEQGMPVAGASRSTSAAPTARAATATPAETGPALDDGSQGDRSADDLPMVPRPTGGSPADGAREILRQRTGAPAPAPEAPAAAPRSAGRPTPPPRSAGARRPPAPTRTASAETTPAEPTATGATAEHTSPVPEPPASTPVGSGSMPSLDTLASMWSASLLSSLSQRARPRFSAGRWLAVDGNEATLGLPNAPHAARCEELRTDVEASLTAAFGTPITIRLTVDSGAIDPGDRRAMASGRAARAEEPEEILDREAIDALDDATNIASTGVDRIAAIFPGAELVDEPDA
jgi:DNA polymerase-3 subunit gamma/tau